MKAKKRVVVSVLTLVWLVIHAQSTYADDQVSLHDTEQTIHIQKVVKEGKERASLEGINGAHFVVYDLTNLLNEMIREGKTDKQSVEQIEQRLKERAKRLAPDQLKKVAEGETQTVDQKRGMFSFSTRLMENRKKAYYLVNTSSPTNISNSEAIVFLTPVCTEAGNVQADVWLYPKAQKKRPKMEVKRIVSTGIKRSWWSCLTDKVKGWFG